MAPSAWASSRTEFLLTETMDQAHSVEFYRQISCGDPAALHVLIQAGAGFHLRDGDPGLPDNVRVLTLPAYSPEFNPIEGLWDQVKDSLCNRVFDTLAELEAVLQIELRRFWQDARRVHSLGPRTLAGSAVAGQGLQATASLTPQE